jgi:hypothetical protein
MIEIKPMDNRLTAKPPSSRLKGWGALFMCLFLLWGFTFHVFPWIKVRIPGMMTLERAIEARDIDTTTFFYSETKESYEAESYLNDTLSLAKPRGYDGFDLFFLLGIALCFIILAIGFRLMSGKPANKMDDKRD